MEQDDIIEVYQIQLGGADDNFLFLESHKNGVLEKIKSLEEYMTLCLEGFEEFFVDAVQNDKSNSPNHIVVNNGLINYVKLLKAIGVLKNNIEGLLDEIVNETYNSLNTNNHSNLNDILQNFSTMETNIEKFKNYSEQRYDNIQLSVDFGLSQSNKSLAWHAATHLKTKFSNYKHEVICLKRELNHISTSMIREIKSACDSKPKPNEKYDSFHVTSQNLQLERNAKNMYNKELSENEKERLIPKIDRVKERNLVNKKDARKRKDQIETSFDPVVKSSKKIDNNNKNDKSNESNRPISCAQETCAGTFKTETELTKHISRCHSDSFIMK